MVRLHQAVTAVPPSGLPVDPDVATAGSTRATVMALLRTLPNRQRQVLVLRYFANLSESEIADALGISPGSVKTHAARGMSAMAQALGEVR